MSQVTSSFAIDLEKLKSLGINDPRSKAAMEMVRSKLLTSDQRLFLSLWGSNLLKTVLFEPKKKIITAGNVVEEGYLIISGSLVGIEGDHIYRLGPGAVLGLAEGVINRPSQMTVITTTSVQAQLIPFHKIDTIISLLPKEVKGILHTIVKRTLALQ
ncbi:MAG: cyclic nucleotide-binding domain-containing protein [Betaproteobacteria bacterium]